MVTLIIMTVAGRNVVVEINLLAAMVVSQSFIVFREEVFIYRNIICQGQLRLLEVAVIEVDCRIDIDPVVSGLLICRSRIKLQDLVRVLAEETADLAFIILQFRVPSGLLNPCSTASSL